MKTMLSAAVAVLSITASMAADPPPGTGAPVSVAAPSAPDTTSSTPPSAAGSTANAGALLPPATTPADGFPPIVRLPVTPENATSTEATSVATPAAEGTAGAGEMTLQTDGVSLRQPAGGLTPSMLRTNRLFETRGVIPRVARPERRGVGGFLSGFANLFNPLAPTRHGVAAGDQNWYDGQANVAPLPRGLRDERTHEPTTSLLSVDLNCDVARAEPASAPAPAKRASP